jgi:dolichol-phosphate mannosyltransferase
MHNTHETATTQASGSRYGIVVIPTYNEALNIERLLTLILSQAARLDVLVVDDNSPDGTGDMVQAMAARDGRIHLLRRAGKLGLGTAYIAGFQYALSLGYQYIIQMDADFSHSPSYLPQMLRYVERGYDVAIGSRNVPGGSTENWPFYRTFISKGGSFYVRMVLGMSVRDCTGGFKCFRAAALQKIDLSRITANGYAFQVEMNYRAHQAGLRMKEFPIHFVDRVFGQSKMSTKIIREAALKVIKLRFGAKTKPVLAPVPGTISQ